MLDKIIDMVRGQVTDTVTRQTDIPEDKKTEVVETTTSSLVDGLKQYATPDNISTLTSMLGIGGTPSPPDSVKAAGISQGLQSNVISNLTSKTGLNAGTAQKIASSVIPAVMALFSRKAKDGDSGFDIGSLVSSFTGNSKSESGGGIMEKIGNLFG